MAAHERWRVFCHTCAQGSYLGIAELRLYDATNTLVTGGTASASDVFSGSYTAAEARDGSTATWWSTSIYANNNSWLALDFGSGNAKDIRRIEINPPPGSGYDQGPNSFAVQFSDDGGTTWTTLRRFTYNWPNDTLHSFDLIGTADVDCPYWRVFTKASADTFVSMAELRLYDQSNTAIAGGTATANREFSGSFDAPKARDGNDATFWASISTLASGSWLAMDFGADKSVSRIEIKPTASPDYDQSPSSFDIESSSDGISWDIIKSHTKAWADDTAQSFIAYAPPTPPSGGLRRPVIVCC